MDDLLDQFTEDRLNGNYGHILDELAAEEFADEFPDFNLDEPWDELLSQQELDDFEQCDEYFGCFGGDEDW